VPSLWLIPLVPAAAAALNGLLGVRWFSRAAAAAIACSAIAVSITLSAWAYVSLLGLAPSARVRDDGLGSWIPAIPLDTIGGVGMFSVNWTARLDPLAAIMLLTITGIGFLIHLYAAASMKDELRASYARFFCYLNLFCAFMLLLVLGGNFLVMFVGWAGAALCSSLLIGFWYEKPRAREAGTTAFLVNAIADAGLLLGIVLIFFTFGTLDFREVANDVASMPRETGVGVLSAICLLLFVGAAGRSAQIPLHVWLPGTMEAPPPVAAFIQASMPGAGVYLVARNAVLFEHAPLVMQLVAGLGLSTAVMAATIALVQTDIKRVLAYSTMSQCGFMFLAAGAGGFAAAIFHSVTHAFGKALLVLGSGSVVQAAGGAQDLRLMGGLRKQLPLTFITMMLGALAISGIPPLAGFFSMDAILIRAFAASRVLWIVAAATAALTAFYMFRVMTLAFAGSSRVEAVAAAAEPARGATSDGSPAMAGTLMTLAVGVIVAGFFGAPPAFGGTNAIERFLASSFDRDPATLADPSMSRAAALGLTLVVPLIAIAGIALARSVSALNVETPRGLPGRGTIPQYPFALERLAVAGTANAITAVVQILAWLAHMIDERLLEGAVNLVGSLARRASLLVRTLQTRRIQTR
jgi:NADH-quinone oxidoreductase subunit L